MVMPTTRSVFLCAALAVPALTVRSAVSSRTSAAVRDAIRAGWDKYDPSVREAHLAARAAAPPSETPGGSGTVSTDTPPAATPAPAERILILPKVTVLGVKDKPPPPLPRLSIAEPVQHIEVNPFETDTARSARLVKKHFTQLEQALNRFTLPFIGVSLAGEAAKKERAESAARQLNSLADLIELSARLGLDDAEAQKKLRAEYLKAYHARPR